MKNRNQVLTIMGTMIFVISLLSFPARTFAVEGTCSWHGGINCSAGSDWDGSTICNDGWRDSSENYYSSQECRNIHFCSTAEYETLKKSYSDYDARVQRATNLIAEINNLYVKKLSIPLEVEEAARGTTQVIFDAQMREALRQNDSAITKLEIEFHPLKFQLQRETDSINAQCISAGESKFNKQFVEQQSQLETQQQTQYQELLSGYCKSLDGPFSHYDTNLKQCSCDKGYGYSDGQCKSADLICHDRIGINSRASWLQDNSGNDLAYCICNTGYIPNASGVCELLPKQTQKISEQALNQAKSQFLSCDNSSLSNPEKSECNSYKLHSDLYNWEVYNKNIESVETANLPQKSVVVTAPTKQELKTSEAQVLKLKTEPATEKQLVKEEPVKGEKKKETSAIRIKTELVKPIKISTPTTTSPFNTATRTVAKVKSESFLKRIFNKLKFW